MPQDRNHEGTGRHSGTNNGEVLRRLADVLAEFEDDTQADEATMGEIIDVVETIDPEAGSGLDDLKNILMEEIGDESIVSSILMRYEELMLGESTSNEGVQEFSEGEVNEGLMDSTGAITPKPPTDMEEAVDNLNVSF